ncbi:FG-GAP repeat domain-containing protein [Streptomyces sp. NPDC101118]|uniref:FG-GAP repeat domain-containing protein n=1 Tax=Streptomyces sp. NPDC101118 TaxID=3366109 RepID=UPI0038131988
MAQDGAQFAHHQHHGALSDTVATGDNSWTGMFKTVTLKDMATGTAAEPLRLATYGLDQYLGTVGSLVVARKNIGVQAQEVHLVEPGSGAGARSDRTVTGLPEGAWGISLEAVTPGAALFEYLTGDGPARRYHYAVVDLATAAVTHTFERVGAYSSPGGTALSATHAAWVEDGASETSSTLVVATRGSGKVERRQVPRLWTAGIALAGDTLIYGSRVDLEQGGEPSDLAIKAMSVTGGASRTVLDHATSFTPAPDGSVLAMGGTLADGEGVYRISPAAPGAPTVTKVATTGEPTAVKVLASEAPAVTALEGRRPWHARWQLSRTNVEAKVVLRHKATGVQTTLHMYPDQPDYVGPGWAEVDWHGLVNRSGWTHAAPNGAYTWTFTATPLNGLGPAATAQGSFTIARKPAPHDYTDNGSPDLLARDSAGRLWREDTVDDRLNPHLSSAPRKQLATGWQIYDRIAAAGQLGGGTAGDVVARDKAGVLWLYLGKGDGTFASRVKVGTGWNAYDEITGGGDLTGDGRADLLARDKNGVLWLHKGTGNWKAPFTARRKVSSGWSGYNQLTAAGQLGGGTAGDLLARDRAGVLWLFLGKGDGTFASRVKVGAGWNTYGRTLGIGDADGDGRADLFAYGPEGRTYLYEGTGDWRKPFRPREGTAVLFSPPYNTVA